MQHIYQEQHWKDGCVDNAELLRQLKVYIFQATQKEVYPLQTPSMLGPVLQLYHLTSSDHIPKQKLVLHPCWDWYFIPETLV